MTTNPPNRRILLIGGSASLHREYRTALRAVHDGIAPAQADRRDRRCGPDSPFEVTDLAKGHDGAATIRRAAAKAGPFAMVVVDVRTMPAAEGLRTIEGIWKADPDIQIVVCTTPHDRWPDQCIERLGFTDRLVFLREPFDISELCLLACGLTTKWNLACQARLGAAELEAITQERTQTLEAEVQERRAAAEEFRHQAMHDPLTGLPNRAQLIEHLGRCMERHRRDPGYRFAVLFLDLDNFKVVNDTLGHDIGDQLLVSIAGRVKAAIRTLDSVTHFIQDTTARLGGDEFIVLLDGLRRPTDAVVVAERIQQRLAETFQLGGHELTISASIGITVAERPYDRPEEILRDADAAMYRAKGSGKARYATFDHRLHTESLARLKLENDLRRAIDEGQFRLVYEPIVATDSAGIIGFEALIRWDHPLRGVLGPADFLAVAEQTGLIVPIGRWVLAEACRQLQGWRNANPALSGLTVSVNLSKRQVMEPGLAALIQRELAASGLKGSSLTVEITERAIMEQVEPVTRTLLEIKSLGVRIHMDDFGTGFSSLACLHEFPVDAIKIDRSFIMNMTAQPQFASLVFAVLTLAQSLNIKVIAEGVETADQLALLLALGCDFIQGYHISKSLSADEARDMLSEGIRWPKAA